MPPIRTHQDHHWTRFELQTMLSLLCRGTHLSPSSASRKDLPSTVLKNTYLNFATELNLALHGTDYEQDIPKREVTKMLERVLREKKAVMGLIERQKTGRITRGVRMAWESGRRGDFDGSVGEWNNGRKEKVEDRRRAECGLPPLDRGAAATALAEVVEKVVTVPSQTQTRIYKKPGRNASRFKSAHTVVESDEEDDEAESARVRGSGKQNRLDVEKLVPAYAGYASPRVSKTRVARTPLRHREREQVEVETPGLVTDDSSPEKMVETPEAEVVTTVYKLGEEGLTKVGGGDIEMADDEMAQELDEELFGL